MSFTAEKRKAIKTYLLEKIRYNDMTFVKKTTENFGISITTVSRYIQELIELELIHEDSAYECGYCLDAVEVQWELDNNGELEEDEFYGKAVGPILQGISKNSQDIWYYAFTEIMNNAIEHSRGNKIYCSVRKDYLYTEISIVDNGIGAYNSIKEYARDQLGINLDIQEALMELYKGKLTTKPENHSGEGIFFTSKMLNSFALMSQDTIFSYHCDDKNKFVSNHLISYYTKIKEIGTMAVMKLENDVKRTSKEIFDLYAPLDEGFVKTLIPMKELCTLGNPVARSQARRILKRLDDFKEVIFDFQDIEFMGQGFSDEVFRVFHNNHPEVVLTVINANETVLGMIKHVQR